MCSESGASEPYPPPWVRVGAYSGYRIHLDMRDSQQHRAARPPSSTRTAEPLAVAGVCVPAAVVDGPPRRDARLYTAAWIHDPGGVSGWVEPRCRTTRGADLRGVPRCCARRYPASRGQAGARPAALRRAARGAAARGSRTAVPPYCRIAAAVPGRIARASLAGGPPTCRTAVGCRRHATLPAHAARAPHSTSSRVEPRCRTTRGAEPASRAALLHKAVSREPGASRRPTRCTATSCARATRSCHDRGPAIHGIVAAVPPYCRSGDLPFCRIAVLPGAAATHEPVLSRRTVRRTAAGSTHGSRGPVVTGSTPSVAPLPCCSRILTSTPFCGMAVCCIAELAAPCLAASRGQHGRRAPTRRTAAGGARESQRAPRDTSSSGRTSM